MTARGAKNPPEETSGGSLLSLDVRPAQAFMAPFTASAVIGSERTRAPEALKIALPSAGAITVTAGSPTPVAFSPLAMTLTATSGIWLIRKGVWVSKLVATVNFLTLTSPDGATATWATQAVQLAVARSCDETQATPMPSPFGRLLVPQPAMPIAASRVLRRRCAPPSFL